MHQLRMTKHTPKVLCYNPITGELKDTSKITYKPPAQRAGNPFLTEYRSQGKLATEFASLSAFQQPRYTKHYPKHVPSFPVTGLGVKEEKSGEAHLADYGSMLMKPPRQ